MPAITSPHIYSAHDEATIEAKYKGNKGAVSTREAAIAKGGSLEWKFPMAMPPKGMGATDTEIKEMADFIAGLAH